MHAYLATGQSNARAPLGKPRAVALGVLLLAVAPLAAALPDTSTPLLRFERRTVADGLSHNAVRDTAVDSEGYLWLATDDGLNRFDGITTRVFRFDPDSGRRNRFQSTAEAPDGSRWVGADHGVYRLAAGSTRLEPVEALAGTRIEYVDSMLRDSRGQMWVGGLGQFLRVADQQAEAIIPCAFDAPGPLHVVRDIVEDVDGSIWALFVHRESSHTILVAVDPKGLGSACTRVPGVGLNWGMALIDGVLWVGRHRAIVDGDRVGSFEPIPGLPEDVTLTSVAETEDRVWFGTNLGVFVWDARRRLATRVEVAAPASWLRSLVNEIRVDADGGVWVSTLNGVLHWDPRFPRFEHLDLTAGAAPGSAPGSIDGVSVSSLAADGQHLWVGSFDGALSRVDLRTRATEHFGTALLKAGCSEGVWSVALDERAVDRPILWVGTDDGLCRLDTTDGSVKKHSLNFPSNSGGLRIKQLLRPSPNDPDRSLWLLTIGAIARYDPDNGRLQLHVLPEGLGDQGFEPNDAIVVDDDVWIGSAWGGLLKIGPSGTEFHRLLSESGAPLYAAILGLHAVGDALWLATSNGLLRFDPAARSTKQVLTWEALPSSVVYSVISDDNDALWLGTAAGLVRYEPTTGALRRFGPQDGVRSLEFNRHAVFAGGGRLFFGGNRGLTWIDPDSIVADRVPPAPVLERVDLQGPEQVRSVVPFDGQSVFVAAREENLAIHYSAPALVRAWDVEYRYRMTGLSEQWLDVGRSRVARFSGIRPGRYTFEAQARNGEGIWGPVARLPVVVRPTLFESRTFQGLIVILACGGLAAAARVRRHRRRDIERLRLNIATDLHDDIGSELSGIALAAAMAGREADLPERQSQAWLRISEKAKTMLEAIRHVVWSIDPVHDNTQSLVERMRLVAGDLLVASTWNLSTNLGATPRRLSTQLRRSLFLAFKELLHNVARHAHASQVNISLQQRAALLELVVTDDGVGFDPKQHKYPADGMGLRGLRRRALAAGGRFEIESGPGEGTRVVFAVPTRSVADLIGSRRGSDAASPDPSYHP